MQEYGTKYADSGAEGAISGSIPSGGTSGCSMSAGKLEENAIKARIMR